MFFINLCGTDSLGSIYNQHSLEYKTTTRQNGENIQKIVEAVDNFYNNDGRTAYIVTSDHGKNDMGVHGDGSYENTITPFVAWGAGINLVPDSQFQLIEDEMEHFGDDYYIEWGNLKG